MARVWDFVEDRRVLTLDRGKAPILSVAVTPDGRWFVTCADGKPLTVWGMSRTVGSWSRGRPTMALASRLAAPCPRTLR